MEYLIVEDTEEYRKIAKEVVIDNGNNVAFAKNYKEADELLDKNKFDRVITDLFFPESKEKNVGEIGKNILQNIFRESTEDPENWEMAPLGLYVFGKAYSKGIPVLIASQGNRHHGKLGAVRYAVNDFFGHFSVYRMMAKFGMGLNKKNSQDWKDEIISEKKFEYVRKAALKQFSKVEKSKREKIFGF